MSDLELQVEFIINQQKVNDDLVKIENDMKGIGTTAEASAAKTALSVKTIYSDSAAEIEAYKRSIGGIGGVTLSAKDSFIRELNKDLEKGKITAAEFKRELAYFNTPVTSKLSPTPSDLIQRIGLIKQLEAELKVLKTTQNNSFLEGQLGSTNRKIQETEAEIGRLQNVGKKGFDELGNAVKGSTNFIGKAFGAVRKLAYILPGVGIAGILAFALGPILDYIAKLDLFGKKVTEAIKLRQELNNVALKGNQSAQGEITTLKLLYKEYQNSNLPLEKRKEAYNELQKLYPSYFGNLSFEQSSAKKVKGAYDELTTSILATARARAAADKIAENSSRQLGNEQVIRDEEAKILSNQLKLKTVGLKGNSTNGSSLELAAAGEIDKRIFLNDGINKSQKIINDAKTDSNILTNRNLELEKNITKEIENGGKLTGGFGDKIKLNNKELNSAYNLQLKINEAISVLKNKSLSKDESEIQTIKDKFKKISDEVERFNTNPKNKYKVDGSGLKGAEKQAISDVTYRQDTDALKSSLDAQKKIYADFEKYKNELGEEKAKERYSKELTIAKNTQEKAARELAGLVAISSTGGSLNGRQKERLFLLIKSLKEESDLKKEVDDKDFIAAFNAAKTHSQKLLDINQDFFDKVKALGKNASVEQIGILEKDRKEKSQAENISNLDTERGYANLFASFDKYSKEKVKEVVETEKKILKVQLDSGNISAVEYHKLIAKFDAENTKFGNNNAFAKVPIAIKKWTAAINDFGKGSQEAKTAFKEMAGTVGQAADAAGAIFGDVVNTLEGLGIGGDKYTQQTLKSVEGLIGGIGDLGKGLASGNPVDIIKGSIEILTNAIDLFNNKDDKLQRKIDAYQADLKQLQNNFADLEKQINNSVGESIYTDSAKAIENLKKQQEDLAKSAAAERAKKKSDAGKVAEYEQGIKSAQDKIDALNKAIAENLIQTTFKDLSQSLTDAFTEAFAAGEDAAGRFDKAFDLVIKNAIKNSLKLKLIEPTVKQFTDDLTAYAKANGNSVIGFDFDKYKALLKNAGDQYTAALAGLGDLFKADVVDAQSNTLSGQVKGITADQADLLAGQFGGLRLTQLQTNELLKLGNVSIASQMADTKAMLAVQIQIEANTLRFANSGDTYLPYLKSIDQKLNDQANALKAGGKGP